MGAGGEGGGVRAAPHPHPPTQVVPRHLDTRGEHTIVHWQEVAKDMRAAGYLRSAEALSAHFRAEHEPMTQQPPATPPAPVAGETHPNFFWTAQEERELWRLTEKFADKTSGKIAWQKVHDQLAKVRQGCRARSVGGRLPQMAHRHTNKPHPPTPTRRTATTAP